MSSTEPTRRFSNRVQYYLLYRPRYPSTILDFFRTELNLKPEHVIADIGSGTGFLSELFLRNGNPVIGIEPNDEMRRAGDELLRAYPGFRSVKATAEETTLVDRCADFVVAGQAFHWFDATKARLEWRRILKLGGVAALIWNQRLTDNSDFARAYEHLLRQFATDYEMVSHRTITASEEALHRFFEPGGCQLQVFENHQDLDCEGLKGRLLSSSYVPLAGDPRHKPMMTRVDRLFEEHQRDGVVRIDYATQVYYGRLL